LNAVKAFHVFEDPGRGGSAREERGKQSHFDALALISPIGCNLGLRRRRPAMIWLLFLPNAGRLLRKAVCCSPQLGVLVRMRCHRVEAPRGKDERSSGMEKSTWG
jgi:hypothetical protein